MNDLTIEYRLGHRERILLERLVRALEKWTQTEVPPELSAEIDKMAVEADALKRAQETQQGA